MDTDGSRVPAFIRGFATAQRLRRRSRVRLWFHRRRCAAPGFTLIEVLVAVGIFAVAFAGVFAVLAAGAESRRRAEDGTEAAIIATSLVAEARARFREAGSLREVKDQPWPTNPRYSFDLGYIPLDRDGEEVFMRVRVYWLRGGKRRHVDFDTILLRKPD